MKQETIRHKGVSVRKVEQQTAQFESRTLTANM